MAASSKSGKSERRSATSATIGLSSWSRSPETGRVRATPFHVRHGTALLTSWSSGAPICRPLVRLDMAGSSADRRCGRMRALMNVFTITVCGSAMASCASESYQEAAMQASEGGDQKAAISLAKKEVERFSGPDQCSRTASLRCGTLALAYGTLAGYQILDGDKRAG